MFPSVDEVINVGSSFSGFGIESLSLIQDFPLQEKQSISNRISKLTQVYVDIHTSRFLLRFVLCVHAFIRVSCFDCTLLLSVLVHFL